jgi:hypothetical protein
VVVQKLSTAQIWFILDNFVQSNKSFLMECLFFSPHLFVCNIYLFRFVFKICLFILVPVMCNLFPKRGKFFMIYASRLCFYEPFFFNVVFYVCSLLIFFSQPDVNITWITGHIHRSIVDKVNPSSEYVELVYKKCIINYIGLHLLKWACLKWVTFLGLRATPYIHVNITVYKICWLDLGTFNVHVLG